MKKLAFLLLVLSGCTTNINEFKSVTAEYITTKDNHRLFKTIDSDFIYISVNQLPSEPRYKGIFFLDVDCNENSVCQLGSIKDVAGYQYP